ncbi:MAG: hypothetical protein ACI8P3_002854 [Saprospiraceae bacterium]|jgi:hypothetical protein
MNTEGKHGEENANACKCRYLIYSAAIAKPQAPQYFYQNFTYFTDFNFGMCTIGGL